MPDLQMCPGQTEDATLCQLRQECYRFTAKPSERQAWGPPAPDFDPAKGCENYLALRHEYA